MVRSGCELPAFPAPWPSWVPVGTSKRRAIFGTVEPSIWFAGADDFNKISMIFHIILTYR